MKSPILDGLFILVILAILGWACFSIFGCTAEQLNAASGNFHAAAAATTQPVVQFVEGVAPVTVPWITLGGIVCSAISGVLGGLAGHAAATSSASQTVTAATQSVSTAKTALGEVIGDIAAYRQPGVAWTDGTAKLISDVAGPIAAAAETHPI